MKRKILTAGLAILIAFGLWVYVVTVVRPESSKTYYNIPVVLEGESILTGRDLMIVGGKNATVTMEVYGNRTDLDKINSGNITIVADLTRIDKAGEVELKEPVVVNVPMDVEVNYAVILDYVESGKEERNYEAERLWLPRSLQS